MIVGHVTYTTQTLGRCPASSFVIHVELINNLPTGGFVWHICVRIYLYLRRRTSQGYKLWTPWIPYHYVFRPLRETLETHMNTSYRFSRHSTSISLILRYIHLKINQFDSYKGRFGNNCFHDVFVCLFPCQDTLIQCETLRKVIKMKCPDRCVYVCVCMCLSLSFLISHLFFLFVSWCKINNSKYSLRFISNLNMRS